MLSLKFFIPSRHSKTRALTGSGIEENYVLTSNSSNLRHL
jgi:hypothetical protein